MTAVGRIVGPKWLGGAAAKAMTSTAVFLKERGRIPAIKPDYAAFITDAYLKMTSRSGSTSWPASCA